MPIVSRKAAFGNGFIGRAVPRDSPTGGLPDSQNVIISPDGRSLVPFPGYMRTYPYPLLNGLSAWKHSTTGAVVYAATSPGSSYTQTYGLRVVSVPPQSLLLNSGRAIAIVDEYNSRVVALGYHAGGNPLDPSSTPAHRAPMIEGRLFRLSKHEYPTVLFHNGMTFVLSQWNEPMVYDGETLRPLGIRAPQLPPVTEADGDLVTLDCDPSVWPTSDYSSETLENNPYTGRPYDSGEATPDLYAYWWKLPMSVDAALNFATLYQNYDCFWELAQSAENSRIYPNIMWNREWGMVDPAPAYTQAGGIEPMVRVPGVTFRCYKPMGVCSQPILCQHNLAPKAFEPGHDYLVIPKECKTIQLRIYYNAQTNGHANEFHGLYGGTLALDFSNAVIPTESTSPYRVTANIYPQATIPINARIHTGKWNVIDLPWDQTADFQLRSIALRKMKDITQGHFKNQYHLRKTYPDTGDPNWDSTTGESSIYYVPPSEGGKDADQVGFLETAFVDFTFALYWKTPTSNTSFLYDDDYYFCFSWKNSETGRESAPSPITEKITVKVGTPVILNIEGSLDGYPTGHANSAPDGADKICVYMARSQWGSDPTDGGPLFRFLGEYDVPESGILYLGTERTEEGILSDRSPNYNAYSLPACGLGIIDGQRLVVAGQGNYGIGQVTVESRDAYQIVTRVVDDPQITPQFGPWCEGRRIHFEGQEIEGYVVKACKDAAGTYGALLVSNGAQFLADAQDEAEQHENDTLPRDYTIVGEARRIWWSALTAMNGAWLEGMALTNYLDLDVSPDGINRIGHIGGLVVATSRDKVLYLAQNMSALDDAVDSTGPAFSSSTSRPFKIGCLAGRTFQEVPGNNGSDYGAVWLTPDGGLAVANSEGIVYHPVSDILRSYLKQPDKVSQFELQHALGHYNKADGAYYLFFYSPAGTLLGWSDETPPDPFVEWSE